MRQHQLARAMGLDPDERRHLRHTLRALETEGRILRLRKNRWALPDRGRMTTGRLRVHPLGFGFVEPDAPGASSIYVPRDSMGAALDGDEVRLRIIGKRGKRRTSEPRGASDRSEGQVAHVIRRSRHHLVGLLMRERHYAYVIPDDPRVPHNIRIREAGPGPSPDARHKVRVALAPWTDPRVPLEGTIEEDLGPADAPGVDMLCVLREHDLQEDFPSEVADEAHAFASQPKPADLAGRRDLRDLLIVTIDPEDAKDFDDAVSLTRVAGGGWELGVHIADVSHYVAPASGLDAEARLRGNSVYLVDRVVTMLPPYLTTEVCSLAPGRDRLTHTVCLQLDEEAQVRSVETFPSVIRSAARLDYDQVQSFFDGAPDHRIPDPVRKTLRHMRRLAARLRRKRMGNGALAVSLPEVKCVLDAKGRPLELRCRGAVEAYHVIEEFMLLANRCVAERFARAQCPALYRVHEKPDEAQWDSMADDLAKLGCAAAPGDRADMLRVLEGVDEGPDGYLLMRAVLINLKRAMYSPTLQPHFGLAFDTYSHFTSPIRRYADLVVHRALKSLETGGPPPQDYDEVGEIAAHCTERERNAEEAEQKSLNIKRVRYFQQKLQNGDTGPYRGVILGVREKGLWVELTDSLQRGLVSYATMTEDHYRVLPDGSAAVGRRVGHSWHPGMLVELELIRVDEARRLVDFRIFKQPEPCPGRKGKRKKRKGKGKK